MYNIIDIVKLLLLILKVNSSPNKKLEFNLKLVFKWKGVTRKSRFLKKQDFVDPTQFIIYLKSFNNKKNLDINKPPRLCVLYNFLEFGDFKSPFIFHLHNLKNIILILNITRISFLIRFLVL